MSGAALGGTAPDGGEVWRWGLSFAAVLGLHALVFAGLASQRGVPVEPGEALPAVMIDMAPPSQPPAAPSSAPPSEAATEAALPDPVLEAPPEVPEPDLAPPPETAALEPPDITRPEPPPITLRESAAVPLPPPPAEPAPAPPKPVVKRAEVKPAPKRAEARQRPEPVQARRGERQKAGNRPAQGAGATTAAIASASSGTAAASRASWQGALVAHLKRNLRPQGDQTGVASVRFAVDRGGRVLSASLAASAGSPALDSEAVAVFRRAQPLPAPPPDVPGASFTFTVPIRFSTR